MPVLKQEFTDKNNIFSASHFLPDFGKCERLHGHNYQVEVFVEYRENEPSLTIDFREINSIIHNETSRLHQKILLPEISEQMEISMDLNGENWGVKYKEKFYSFPKQDVVILDKVNQTTSENLAFYLHRRIVHQLKKLSPQTITKLSIKVSETEKYHAIYSDEVK